MSLKLSNIRSVLMTIWRCLMEKLKSHQFLDVYVEIRYQILLLLLEIKCSFALYQMHQCKEKGSKQCILQVWKILFILIQECLILPWNKLNVWWFSLLQKEVQVANHMCQIKYCDLYIDSINLSYFVQCKTNLVVTCV